MSIWTHVNGSIRYDDFRIGEKDNIPELGKVCSFHDPKDVWDSCTVPCGSEGSLKHSLNVNENESSIAAYTATIWGDLRSYENHKEIIGYFKKITDGYMIRSGLFEIHTNGQDPVVYRYDEDKWVKL